MSINAEVEKSRVHFDTPRRLTHACEIYFYDTCGVREREQNTEHAFIYGRCARDSRLARLVVGICKNPRVRRRRKSGRILVQDLFACYNFHVASDKQHTTMISNQSFFGASEKTNTCVCASDARIMHQAR
jgi:hypothetical protein